MGRSGRMCLPGTFLLVHSWGLTELNNILGECDQEWEILEGRGPLEFQQQSVCGLKNTSLRIQDLICAAKATCLSRQLLVLALSSDLPSAQNNVFEAGAGPDGAGILGRLMTTVSHLLFLFETQNMAKLALLS